MKNGKSVRRVKISRQRQINIPKEYHEALNLEDEAFLEFTGKEIIIRPADPEVIDFSEDILRDLVSQGYEGDQLIEEFTRIKSNISKALDYLKQETRKQPTVTGSLDEYLDAVEDEDEDE
ncbi:AbrB/MazE/SpoVT family DNA-binding domain-containing protein [Bacillus piscicola]|uniref:AbrB/MazE/SpoVT family DNA-binding domain-containing protein n=1 Tax=Bacillus piscicola TaxID=1632684 RepID=UPI001F091FCC|nr:AbrB/MazE/SpoVT family DNA-binding domain-containing protein [Bacillus piscicola]